MELFLQEHYITLSVVTYRNDLRVFMGQIKWMPGKTEKFSHDTYRQMALE